LNGSFFPSGHAVRATVALGLAVALLVPHGSGWGRAALAAALALLLAVGAARVAVHGSCGRRSAPRLTRQAATGASSPRRAAAHLGG
jgi:hypothetical protein